MIAENGAEHRLNNIGAAWPEQLVQLLTRVADHGVTCAPGAADRLLLFCRAIAARNHRVGLVSRQEVELLVEKHVAASLGVFLLESPQSGERWMDVGTGGGFPGMVVKLCHPEQPMTLLDSSRKKTIFLEGIREDLGLEGLRIIEARVENLRCSASSPSGKRPQVAPPKQHLVEQPYDVILMRAVAPLHKALPWIEDISHSGTRFLTYKGPGWREEVTAAAGVLEKLNWRLETTTQIPWAQPKILHFLRSSR